MTYEGRRQPVTGGVSAAPGAVLSVRLDPDTVGYLRELAQATGLSPAQLVQAWVRERARREHYRIPA
jgi:predicted transcriptional regulator